MKRSEINAILREGAAFIDKCGFALPPFSKWTAEEYQKYGAECAEIRDALLGWDITDFGSGDFSAMGLLLFTIRNGVASMPDVYHKAYAEKLLVVREGQFTPYHFHHFKMEDIINRSGATLCIQLYNAADDDGLCEKTRVLVSTDGRNRYAEPGAIVRLQPGESITLFPRLYHQFWAEGGDCLVGEVSRVNDDQKDNRFLIDRPRFPDIEEDESALYLLSTDARNLIG